ncbi:MAG TPA: metalloregulator ArsR/SmtB family transcription factor [Saprospiraceae bacterium]|nr:metalloregulator ArsR/SmtB family transcription factor [Saprospiraceae bacterium]HNM25054.1 metalloregulator ArsR/SmtB family transcription factor [Saprospiraceae bacterium]
MASPKLAAFGADENELAELAKALGHPARIAILKELARRKSCVCGEIVEVLPLAQSTVSQHLKELKAAGLIQGTVEGAKSCYCINWDNVRRLQNLIGSFIDFGSGGPSCC